MNNALHQQRGIIQLMEGAQLKLRQWSSNHPDLLSHLKEDERGTDVPLEIGKTESFKTLGLLWNPASEEFLFLPPENSAKFTTRLILSCIAPIYELIGYLAPVVLLVKIFMRILW